MADYSKSTVVSQPNLLSSFHGTNFMNTICRFLSVFLQIGNMNHSLDIYSCKV